MTPSSTQTPARSKDLLPNEQEVTFEKFQNFLQQNKIVIASLCIALILGALGFTAWQIQKDKKIAQADAALAAADSPEALELVASNYADTEAGLLASLLVADRYFQQKQWDKASAAYQNIINQHFQSPLAPSARIGLAAVLESTGKIDDAVKTYKSAAADFPDSFQAPQALFSAARLLEVKQPLEARKIYEEIITSHSESAWKSEAEDRLKSLETSSKASAH